MLSANVIHRTALAGLGDEFRGRAAVPGWAANAAMRSPRRPPFHADQPSRPA